MSIPATRGRATKGFPSRRTRCPRAKPDELLSPGCRQGGDARGHDEDCWEGDVALASGALAGCTNLGDDSTAAAEWHYDAGARFGVSTVAVATVDFEAVRSAPLPDRVAREIASLDGDVESVDAESVDGFAATAFADRAGGPAGASVVAPGTFDAEAFGEELRSEGLDPVEWYRDVDRYEDTSGTAFAVGETPSSLGSLRGRNPASTP